MRASPHAPDYDHTGSTAILAAQMLLNFLGFVFHGRTQRAATKSLEAAK